MPINPQQRLMLMLTVDVSQILADFFEHRGGGDASVDAANVLTGAVDFPGD